MQIQLRNYDGGLGLLRDNNKGVFWRNDDRAEKLDLLHQVNISCSLRSFSRLLQHFWVQDFGLKLVIVVHFLFGFQAGLLGNSNWAGRGFGFQLFWLQIFSCILHLRFAD